MRANRHSLELGTTRKGATVTLSGEDRATHLQVLGASGKGKTKLLERMIRQDIVRRRGVCVIDPHGELYENLVSWCGVLRNPPRIHLIDPSHDEWRFGFNPLHLDGVTEPSVRVDAMVKACAQVWGGEDTARTPLLKKCLRAIFYTLAINNLTLLEAIELASASDPNDIRRYLTSGIEDPIFGTVWEDFNKLPIREFAEQFSSTNNRLLEFLAAPSVRSIIGQREHIIDFRECMDAGDVVLVNLAPTNKLSFDNARLLGTLLVNDLFITALGRTPNKSRPFYLYIDECYQYLNEDISQMLDQTRKFGLHLILSHQRLGQLRQFGESIYNAVMTGAQTKVVFGGLEASDAEALAQNIFLGEFDLEKVKHVLDKPVVVDEIPEWLLSESETEGESHSFSEGSGETVTEYEDEETGLRSTTESQSSTDGFSRSHSSGKHQTFRPVRKVLPGSTYSLDDLMHQAVVKLVNQKRRFAIVKMPGRTSCQIRTLAVKKAKASRDRVDHFKQKALEGSAFSSRVPLIELELDTRREWLLEQAAAHENPPDPPKGGFRQKF